MERRFYPYRWATLPGAVILTRIAILTEIVGNLNRQPWLSLLYPLHQQEGGGMARPVGDQIEALGLQIVGPEGAEDVRQPLRTVAQRKTAPVFYQPPGGGAQLRQGAKLLAPGGAAALPAAHGEIGRVGYHQVEAPGGEGFPPQVTGENFPGQTVGFQVFPGNAGGQRVRARPSARRARSRRSAPLPVPRSHTRQPGFTVEKAPRARASPPRGKTPSSQDRV